MVRLDLSTARGEPVVEVKDVMSSPVRIARETDDAAKVAKTMNRYGVGSVVVVDKKRNPLGLITEKDIVRRVAAKGLHPAKVKAGKIMTRPLRTVEPALNVREAMRRMRQQNVKRFAVMDAGKLVGMVTGTDIVRIAPSLIDIVEEKSKAGLIARSSPRSTMAGYCDECGSWSDNLKSRDGSFLCSDCASEARQEEA